MDKNIGYKDFKNIGGYKSKLTKNLETSFDTNSMLKIESFLNGLTDTLYLPLARGVRIPALAVAKLYYDETADYWAYRNAPYNSVSLVVGLDVQNVGKIIQYLDVTVNPLLEQKSDISSLYFTYNLSDCTDDEADTNQTLFPRVDSIINDNTVRVALERVQSSTMGFLVESLGLGSPGFAIGFEVLFQSEPEHADKAFFTPGVPYFELTNVYTSINSLRPAGFTYSDMLPDASRTPWNSKIRSCAQYYDTTLGDSTGALTYSMWETAYTSGKHEGTRIEGLLSDSTYRVWVQINSKVGPDNYDATSIGLHYTKSIGEDPGEDDLPGIGDP